MIELLIQNDKLYAPIIEGDITWETSRKSRPGKLIFTILKDRKIDIQEGNCVLFKYNKERIFYGFIFKKSRRKNGNINIIAYDQLRYFKNKDTYVYKNKTATEFVRMMGQNFNLNMGELDDTKFKIVSRIEDNKTLFDMGQNALDITLQNTGKLYVLYDSFGKLQLRDAEAMKVDYLIDDESAEDYNYSSSIENAYNKIKLSYANKKSGKREIYIAQDSSNMNEWGTLQLYDSIDEKVNGKAKADALLELFNKKARSLSINGVFGDVRVRGGTSIPVKLDIGDLIVRNYMLVDSARHRFSHDFHSMDLKVNGGGFFA